MTYLTEIRFTQYSNEMNWCFCIRQQGLASFFDTSSNIYFREPLYSFFFERKRRTYIGGMKGAKQEALGYQQQHRRVWAHINSYPCKCSLFALAHASFSIQFNLFASNKIPFWLRVCRYARKYVWLGYAIKTIFSCMTQKWIIRWCSARFFVVVSSVYRAARLWRMQILAAKQFFTIIWTDRTISMTTMTE